MKAQFTITELRLMCYLIELYKPDPIKAENDRQEELFEAADGLYQKLQFMVGEDWE